MMAFKILLAIYLAAIGAVAAEAQSRPPDLYLDITAYPMTGALQGDGAVSSGAKVRQIGWPKGSVDTRQGSNVGGVRVTLLSLDKTYYQVGDYVIYEVQIENVGKTPIVVPWSPDIDRFPPGQGARFDGYLSASIVLEVETRSASRRLGALSGQLLQGSKDYYGTLQELAPGQRAVIRVPAYVRTSESELNAILAQPQGGVRVRAQLRLPSEKHLVRSANHVDVNILPSPTGR